MFQFDCGQRSIAAIRSFWAAAPSAAAAAAAQVAQAPLPSPSAAAKRARQLMERFCARQHRIGSARSVRSLGRESYRAGRLANHPPARPLVEAPWSSRKTARQRRWFEPVFAAGYIASRLSICSLVLQISPEEQRPQELAGGCRSLCWSCKIMTPIDSLMAKFARIRRH